MTAKIKVSKLDAARRQLDTAIELWFQEKDPVSIEALVSNASQIVQDLNEKKGNKEVTLLGMAQKFAKPEHIEEVMRLWKKPMTFLKHANRDPHDILELHPEAAEIMIVLALYAIELLGENISDVGRAFTIWQSFHRPNLFLKGANPFIESLDDKTLSEWRQIKKSDFLKGALLGFAKRRAADL